MTGVISLTQNIYHYTLFPFYHCILGTHNMFLVFHRFISCAPGWIICQVSLMPYILNLDDLDNEMQAW